jgi:hypothetical protein
MTATAAILATSSIEKPIPFYMNVILDIENGQAVNMENLIVKISPETDK